MTKSTPNEPTPNEPDHETDHETGDGGRTMPWTTDESSSNGASGASDAAAAAAETEPPGFTSGTVLQNRYRIIERLGAGTMGEVYHAQDLRLHQDVALKFLTEYSTSQGDEQSRHLLLNEIRLARRITHPNVCRVHDLGDLDGRLFVSMEYVRGEDLAALLRRIGRMTGEKAHQLGRQICAGLQAAHDQGVLHRDLKPANILIDAKGNVRITDFGIAAATDGDGAADAVGSPAYMAPELFTGGGASKASDIYSLGLVLFELYTGERLFRADSMTSLLKLHRQPVALPRERVPEIDREVERAVLTCLQRNPDRRPPSAVAVLAELPGMDPLAEALAAGQTPSPALVAAAGGGSRVNLRRAVLLALATLAAFILVAWADPHVKLLAKTPTPLSPFVLEQKGREILQEFGHPVDALELVSDFELHQDVLDAIARTRPRHEDWERLLSSERSQALGFWIRATTKPGSLQPANIKGRVRWNDPAQTAGMVRLELDPSGRLHSYEWEPMASGVRSPGVFDEEEPMPELTPVSLERLCELAGLDLDQLETTPPRLVPATFADVREARIGPGRVYEDPDVRVEAAFLDERPVTFTVAEMGPFVHHDGPGRGHSWRFVARVLLLITAALSAWGSLRRGRGDRLGAFHLGLATFFMVVGFTVLTGDHGDNWSGVGALALSGMSHGLGVAAELAVYYLALEPHVRRIWPETLVSWTRLLSGKFRDPYVASSVLVGTCAGAVSTLLLHAVGLVQYWFDEVQRIPTIGRDQDLEQLAGTSSAIGVCLEMVVDVVRDSMMMLVALVLLRMLLRRTWLAATVTIVIWTANFVYVFEAQTTTALVIQVALTSVTVVLFVLSAIRFGLVALISGYMTLMLLLSFPSRPTLEVWYAPITMIPGLLILVAAAAALWSISGHRARWVELTSARGEAS